MWIFHGRSRKAFGLAILGAALLIPASATAHVRTTEFSSPSPFGTAGDGIIFEDAPFAGREVVEVRVIWDVVVADGHDAADIRADVFLPIDTHSGLGAGIDLDGPSLGWSGSGTFNHYEATDRYNGFFGEVGTFWGWQSWGLPFDAVDVLPTSRIEIDYISPDPAPPGDANEDGIVNRLDVVTLLNNYRAHDIAACTACDFDTDGQIGLADLAILQANLVASPDTSLVAVPEPSSVALLGIGLFYLLACRRRRTEAWPRARAFC